MARKKIGVNTSKKRPRKSSFRNTSCTKYDYSILLEKFVNIWTSHIFIKYLCEKKIKNNWPTFFKFLFRSLLYTLYVFVFLRVYFFFCCTIYFTCIFLKSRMYFLVRKNSWYVICVLRYSDSDRKWYRDWLLGNILLRAKNVKGKACVDWPILLNVQTFLPLKFTRSKSTFSLTVSPRD